MKETVVLTLALFSFGLLYGQLDSLGCTGTLGDIKYSVLTPEQFKNANGDCWILSDGRFIATSKLAIFGGMLQAPDYQGIFVRGMELKIENKQDKDRSRGYIIGDFQEDAIKEHKHDYLITRVDPSRAESVSLPIDRLTWFFFGLRYYNVPDNHTERAFRSRRFANRETEHSGSHETRPRNATAYIYLRIE